MGVVILTPVSFFFLLHTHPSALAVTVAPLLYSATPATALPAPAPGLQVKINAEGFQAVVDLSGGDMRKAVTAMQSASQFYAGAEVRRDINVQSSINIYIYNIYL